MMRRSALLWGVLLLLAMPAFSLPLAAQTLTIAGGDMQRLPRQGSQVGGGIARFAPLSVLLRDAKGKGISNAPITFHCNKVGQMSCQLTPGGGENGTLTVHTDGNGVATLNQMGGRSLSLYYADGAFTMAVSYRNLGVTFHLAVDPKSGPQYVYLAKIVSGDRQTKPRLGEEPYGGTANFGPMTIEVTDRNGRPAPNVRVWYGCVHAACNYGNTPQYQTDGNGRFTLPSVSEYYGTGWFTVRFDGEVLQPVEFHLQAVDPPHAPVTWVKGARLVAVSGDNQRQPRAGNQVGGGIARFDPMAVRLVGPNGAPIANAPVHFNCGRDRNWSCQLTPSGAENGQMSINTDGNGVATLNRMGGKSLSFYYAAGSRTMQVSYGNIAALTLHFTVTK